MKVRQFVMAYRCDHPMICRLLGEEYESLRPVLRINVEVAWGDEGSGTSIGEADEEGGAEHVRIEFNTPVAARGKRGWLNLNVWESDHTEIARSESGKYAGQRIKGSDTAVKGLTTTFQTAFLSIEYTGVGIVGGCPAESDNDGCFYENDEGFTFVEAEAVDGFKEYCDCEFRWIDAYTEAMKIPALEILGAYKVEFYR